VEQEETRERLRVITHVGMRMHGYCTASGRAILAHLAESRLASLIDRMKFVRYTELTVCSEQELTKALTTVQTLGYCLCKQEYDPNMTCLAAPVFDGSGHVVAALGTSGPSSLHANSLAPSPTRKPDQTQPFRNQSRA
jgi:IclR family transcriptional regulator, KDG regulon repressor